MNQLTSLVIKSVMCVLCLGCNSGQATSHAMPVAPDFALRNLHGDVVRLSSFRGHTVVLDFWASWCPPCIAQVPSMRRLTDKYKPQGVIVLDIDVLDEQEIVQKFLAEHGHFGSDVLLTLTDESTMSAFGVEQFPSTIVVDKRGRIVASYSGGASDDFAKLEATIRRLTFPSPAQRTAKN